MYSVVFEKDRFRVERISVLFILKLFQNEKPFKCKKIMKFHHVLTRLSILKKRKRTKRN